MIGNRQVFVLATVGSLVLLAGLVVLALPGPYEGATLYAMDISHAIQTMDVVGLGLVLLGSGLSLIAGASWQRWMGQ